MAEVGAKEKEMVTKDDKDGEACSSGGGGGEEPVDNQIRNQKQIEAKEFLLKRQKEIVEGLFDSDNPNKLISNFGILINDTDDAVIIDKFIRPDLGVSLERVNSLDFKLIRHSVNGNALESPPQPLLKDNGPSSSSIVHPINSSSSSFEMNDQAHSYITGHDRHYHHSSTLSLVLPREAEVDSEGENDSEWLQIKSSRMIDEFIDVNGGEKEIMKLWNLHMLNHNYTGDSERLIRLACKELVESQGEIIIQKNLYRNFILHITSLFDFGLLSRQGVYQTVRLLHAQMKNEKTANSLRDNWTAQAPMIKPTTTSPDIESVLLL